MELMHLREQYDVSSNNVLTLGGNVYSSYSQHQMIYPTKRK